MSYKRLKIKINKNNDLFFVFTIRKSISHIEKYCGGATLQNFTMQNQISTQ